jgi:hypothetical protein
MTQWIPPSWPLGPRQAKPGEPACGFCNAVLKPEGSSLYFCNISHQRQWMAQQAKPIEWTQPAPTEDRLLFDRVRARLGLKRPGEDAA